MFWPDLFDLFGTDGGPAVGWCFVGVPAVAAVVGLVLLVGVLWDGVRGG